MTPLEEAAQAGYSQEEVNAFLNQKSNKAKAAGYSDEEIQSYIKNNVVQAPEFNQTPVKAIGQSNRSAAPKAPTNLLEAIQTGWGWSNLALGRDAAWHRR